jgi:DHA1 family bicyclomycin/chloramphenicol resistance-like MFS transporter
LQIVSRPPGTVLLAVITGLVFVIGPTTVDLSLPAMPAIQAAIGSASVRVELTLTLLLASLALGQIFFGAVADRYGRRSTLLMSLIVYSAGAFLAAASNSLLFFAAGRVIQALGFGVAALVVRCAVTDVCDERRTARAFSIAVMMVSVGSVIAPAVGGQILILAGWRPVFATMAGYALVVALLIGLALPETLPPEKRIRTEITAVLGTYWHLLRSRAFAIPAFIGAYAAAFQFAYNTGGPAAVIEHYQVTPARAGALFSIIALATAVCSQANASLLKWFSPSRLTSVAVKLSVAAAIAVLLTTFTGIGGVGGLIASLFVLIATLGFIMGNTMAAAISSAGVHAGAASALVGVTQFVFGTAASLPIAVSGDTSGRLMAVLLAVLAALALMLDRRASRGTAPSPTQLPLT